LLGHSYGASALYRAAWRLPEVEVGHFIMLDPVPRWLWGQFQWTSYRLPSNVRAATCFYNPVSLPKSSPIRNVRGNAEYRNVKVTPWHASIPGDAEVQFRIMEIMRGTYEFCLRAAEGVVKVPPVVGRRM
jgi:pimeloyl-ACP methyl ester carboxylesterase